MLVYVYVYFMLMVYIIRTTTKYKNNIEMDNESYIKQLNESYMKSMYNIIEMDLTKLENRLCITEYTNENMLCIKAIKACYKTCYNILSENPFSLKYFHRISIQKTKISDVEGIERFTNINDKLMNYIYDISESHDINDIMNKFETYATNSKDSVCETIRKEFVSNINNLSRLVSVCKINRQLPMIESITKVVQNAKKQKGNILQTLLKDITTKPSVRKSLNDLSTADSDMGTGLLDNVSDILNTYCEDDSDRELYKSIMSNMKPLIANNDLKPDEINTQGDDLKPDEINTQGDDSKPGGICDVSDTNATGYVSGIEDEIKIDTVECETGTGVKSDESENSQHNNRSGNPKLKSKTNTKMKSMLKDLNGILKSVNENPNESPDVIIDRLGEMMNKLIPSDSSGNNSEKIDFKELYKTMGALSM